MGAVTMEDYNEQDINRRIAAIEKQIDFLEERDDEDDEEDRRYAELVDAYPSADFGKWADIRYKYLCSKYPDTVEGLLQSDLTYSYLTSIQSEYEEKFNKLVEEQLQLEAEEYQSRDELGKVRMENMIRAEVQEIIIDQLSQEVA